MSNCLVEIKNEFTIHLIKLLHPLIYEGIQSIYDRALKCCELSVLKTFQDFLSEIPNWNQIIINDEVDRIKAQLPSYFDGLLKAAVKSNITMLTCNNSTINFSPDMHIFIQTIYKEAAREFYNNPVLLYHKYTPIEIKKNQRDALDIIKQSIQDAIRKILPMDDIINKYLEENLLININKVGSPKNLEHNKSPKKSPKNNDLYKNNELVDFVPKINKEHINNDLIASNLLDKIENKIHTENYNTPKNIEKQNKDIKNSITSDINSKLNISSDISTNKTNLDKKLENVLKDLGNTDTDLDTNIHYTPENNPKNYQEIYSNNKPNNYFQPLPK
jgi:hypothetical protein